MQFCVAQNNSEVTDWIKQQAGFLKNMMGLLVNYLNNYEKKQENGGLKDVSKDNVGRGGGVMGGSYYDIPCTV